MCGNWYIPETDHFGSNFIIDGAGEVKLITLTSELTRAIIPSLSPEHCSANVDAIWFVASCQTIFDSFYSGRHHPCDSSSPFGSNIDDHEKEKLISKNDFQSLDEEKWENKMQYGRFEIELEGKSYSFRKSSYADSLNRSDIENSESDSDSDGASCTDDDFDEQAVELPTQLADKISRLVFIRTSWYNFDRGCEPIAVCSSITLVILNT